MLQDAVLATRQSLPANVVKGLGKQNVSVAQVLASATGIPLPAAPKEQLNLGKRVAFRVSAYRAALAASKKASYDACRREKKRATSTAAVSEKSVSLSSEGGTLADAASVNVVATAVIATSTDPATADATSADAATADAATADAAIADAAIADAATADALSTAASSTYAASTPATATATPLTPLPIGNAPSGGLAMPSAPSRRQALQSLLHALPPSPRCNARCKSCCHARKSLAERETSFLMCSNTLSGNAALAAERDELRVSFACSVSMCASLRHRVEEAANGHARASNLASEKLRTCQQAAESAKCAALEREQRLQSELATQKKSVVYAQHERDAANRAQVATNARYVQLGLQLQKARVAAERAHAQVQEAHADSAKEMGRAHAQLHKRRMWTAPSSLLVPPMPPMPPRSRR